jgi:hypothetical protein
MKKNNLFLWLFALIIFAACEDKDHPVPTPQPEPYVNKFNCKINGKYWEVIPKALYRPIQYNSLIVELFTVDKESNLKIWAENLSENNGIRLGIPIIVDNKIVYNTRINPYYNHNLNCGLYYLDSTKVNTVRITKVDLEAKNIKGFFEFSAFEPNCKDTVQITDGYFDVNY